MELKPLKALHYYSKNKKLMIKGKKEKNEKKEKKKKKEKKRSTRGGVEYGSLEGAAFVPGRRSLSE